jgi:hypothetical protein
MQTAEGNFCRNGGRPIAPAPAMAMFGFNELWLQFGWCAEQSVG